MEKSNGGGSLFFLRHIDAHLRKTNYRFISEVLRKKKLHAVGEVASTIIHDLKNPMTTIMLLTDVIKEVSGDRETEKHCDMISRQVPEPPSSSASRWQDRSNRTFLL